MAIKKTEYPGKGRPLDETKRVARILGLVRMIDLSPNRYLRRDLAGHFEISERMIQKDLDVIRHGLKLDLHRTPQGYFFESLPKLSPVGFTVIEAAALLLGITAASRVSGIDEDALRGAFQKLEALFPPEFAPLLNKALNPRNSKSTPTNRSDTLLLLNRALAEKRKVEITYFTLSRNGEATQRIVLPYCVLPHVRSWHLIGHCELRNGIRIFKVDRIQHARLLPDRFRLPDGFDVESYLESCWGVMRVEDQLPEEVRLRFQPEAGTRVSEERWHPSQEIRKEPDGSVVFRVKVAVTPELISWILYYGAQVEVMEPVHLRKKAADAHRRAADLYTDIELHGSDGK